MTTKNGYNKTIKQIKKDIKGLEVGDTYLLPNHDSINRTEDHWIYRMAYQYESDEIYEYKHRYQVLSIAIARLKGMP